MTTAIRLYPTERAITRKWIELHTDLSELSSVLVLSSCSESICLYAVTIVTFQIKIIKARLKDWQERQYQTLFSAEPPNVGRPRWSTYSESTMPMFLVRSPYSTQQHSTLRNKKTTKDVLTWLSHNLPVRNIQAESLYPIHGLSHSVKE